MILKVASHMVQEYLEFVGCRRITWGHG